MLNNKELGFSSASETLNYGVENTKGDIIVFVHQDIELLDRDLLKNLVEYCDNYEFGIGGVAGVVESTKKVYSSVVNGENRVQAGEPISEPVKVDACDECLFFVKRKDFLGFENLGNTWHLYSIEYSMRCQDKGKSAFVFPLPVFHLSPGWSMSSDYWTTLYKIGQKYKLRKKTPTTVGVYDNGLILPVYIGLKKMKNAL